MFIENPRLNAMVKSIIQLSMGNDSIKRRKIKGSYVAKHCRDCGLRLSSRSFLRIHI